MPLAGLQLPHLDGLTAFGLIAVSLMLIFYAVEARSRHFVLAFAGACVMGSAYGFLQGAWPFGVVEGVWSVVAVRRWWRSSVAPTSPAGSIGDIDAFLADVKRIARQTGPTTYAFPGDGTAGEPSGFVQLYRPVPGQVLIFRIWSTHPGLGCGSNILRALCDLADEHVVELVLRPLPFGPRPHPMSAEQLRAWYDRMGFVGSMKRMVRKPALLAEDSAGPLSHVLVGEG
jgi:hypothetical protein